MNNYLEDNVVGAFIMSDYAKTKLPSVNPNWFNDFNKRVVVIMQQLYLDSKPIAMHTLFPFFKDKAFELSQLTSKFYSDATIEYDLLQMEVMYKRKKIVEEIQNLDLDCELHEIQNKLEIINQ